MEQYAKVIEHTMDEFEQAAAKVVADTIQNAANGTDRSAQASEFRLGMSNIGHCQQAAVFMIKQTPPSDERKKTAAFFGTVSGEAIERQMKLDHPGWLFQAEGVFPIPSGGDLGCHVDIVVPAREAVTPEQFLANAAAGTPEEVFVQGIWDLKSKDKLDVIKKYGPSKQQVYQVTGYAKAMTETLLLIDRATGEPTTDPNEGDPVTDENGVETGETVLDPTKPIWITDVYYDRSGAQDEAYSFGWFYDPAVLLEIDDWIHDLKYAVVNNTEASKDKSRDWCLAAETEVLTRDGIFPIGSLAGQRPELLIPGVREGGGLAGSGTWQDCEIKSFGFQPLRKITLSRGSAKKVIHATPEHKWFVKEIGRHVRHNAVLTTDELQPTMALRQVRIGGTVPVEIPFGVAQGFMFGDGVGARKGRLDFYPNSPKLESMRGYFSGHRFREHEEDGRVTVEDLPSHWKDLPDPRWDRKFLLSWLSGYFAADGHQAKNGTASISSAQRDHVEFARLVCHLNNIRCSTVQTQSRVGFRQTEASDLFTITLNWRDLPEWFFKNSRHADNLPDRPANDLQWKVVSVEETDRVEEVYCAVVPGVEAFALADGILTHNCWGYCEYATLCRGNDTDVEGLIEDPEILASVNLYSEGLDLVRAGEKKKDNAKLTIPSQLSGSTGTHNVRWIEIGPTEVKAGTRAGYRRLDIRPIPGPKKPPAPRKKKIKEEEVAP